MVRSRRLFLLVTSSILLIISWAARAQEETCPALVRRALEAVGSNCGVLDTNVACYGFDLVDSTFSVPVEPGFFSEPSDQTVLTTLQSIRTTPLDTVLERWGIAVMNVQANVPNTFPGQNVTFILMGDAQIDNAVPADTALEPATPVTVTVETEAVAHSSPTENSNMVGTYAAGTQVDVDALSRESDWLRVLYAERPAWIPRSAVAQVDGLDALPVITSTTRSPMQAFYFSTGFGDAECSEAPNAVTIRTPQNISVDLTVNGVDIRVGSTITLQNVAEDQMAIMVHQGHVNTVDGQTAAQGETIVGNTDGEGRIVEWVETRPMNEAEQQLGSTLIPVMDQIAPQPQAAAPLIHIVQPGETLYSIARLYDASMPEIVQANNIQDVNSIYVGQELLIPNPYSGFVNIATTTVMRPATSSTNPNVDCSAFRPTSPLDGLNQGPNIFYWNGAPGATSYRVNVYNLETGQTVSFTTSGAVTNVTGNVDIPTAGSGFSFAWDVQALFNSQPVCTSARVALQRGAVFSSSPTGPPAFTASWGCNGPNNVLITYANAPAGDTVNITFTYFDGVTTQPAFFNSLPSPSGSVTFGPALNVSAGSATSSSGPTTLLAPNFIDLAACP